MSSLGVPGRSYSRNIRVEMGVVWGLLWFSSKYLLFWEFIWSKGVRKHVPDARRFGAGEAYTIVPQGAMGHSLGSLVVFIVLETLMVKAKVVSL